MNKTIIAGAVTVAVIAGAVAVYSPSDFSKEPGAAQQQAGQNNKQNRPNQNQVAAKLFEKADANNDGFVNRDEFLAQADLRYGTLDKNNDGRVSRDEVRRKELDSNNDGTVTKQEFLAHAGKRLRDRDKNRDGKLDFNEFKNRKR